LFSAETTTTTKTTRGCVVLTVVLAVALPQTTEEAGIEAEPGDQASQHPQE